MNKKSFQELLKKVDYCSGVPDFKHIKPCCKKHDKNYEMQVGKFKADWEFFLCSWTNSNIYYPESDTFSEIGRASCRERV